ncbi:MAG: flagellar hook-basal body complex protein [Pirellulales bacterium]|nr:flagellar hook-basal body complex protein [Pirellulales bacterium]
MGLASALNTALTGMTGAETTIDVVGNNLANANTVGFKASEAVFATQFLQTQGLGSGPTDSSGGTNPRQTGLGSQVAEITPDFSQGTIEISSSPSDLAIQGDGFFIVEGNGGEQLYTRNGIFETNSENELVSITGQRLLGYSVDENFELDTTELSAIEIPLGTAAVAQATENVFLEGVFTPTGDVASSAEIIESQALGDASIVAPTDGGDITISSKADAPSLNSVGAGSLAAGTYVYKVAYVDADGNISTPSESFTYTATAGESVTLDLSVDGTGVFTEPGAVKRVYRTDASGTGPLLQVGGDIPSGQTTFFDDGTLAAGPELDETVIDGTYSYYVTFSSSTGTPSPSRPAPLVGPLTVSNGAVRLDDLPVDTSGTYDRVNIYRNVANDDASFYLVEQIDPAVQTSFIDNTSDAAISDLTVSGNHAIDLDGPAIDISTTNVVDILRRDGTTYENVFQEGTLQFTGVKGDRSLATQELEITSTTKVLDLINFVEQSLGIRESTDDPSNPVPSDASGSPPGGTVNDGKLRFVGNNGDANAIEINLSSFQLVTNDGSVENVNLAFNSVQEAVGESAVTEFVVFDSLGIPLNVRLTTTLESRTGSETTYRWYADSGDNDPLTGVEVGVGTGLITFDTEGNVINVTNSNVNIDRRTVSAASPLSFDLDFSNVSGLATDASTLAATRQDGSAPGTLTSYVIGENGEIRGVFSNGITQTLGQLQLAKFANPTGLEQRGQNLYAAGINSGLPIQGIPGEQGIGSIIAGAVELSNTDIGQNLIDLILASTQYRGNSRVITSAQQLLDELLSLRR